MVRIGADDSDGAWLQSRFPGFRPSRRGDWDQYPYVCICKTDLQREYECGPEQVETEKTECSCLEVTSQGVCKRWYCREYDDAGHDVEHEYYNATAIDVSTGRVHGWVGDIDSRGEFERAECECTLPSDNGRFCVEWQCSERGLPYFYPNLFVSLAHLLVFPIAGMFLAPIIMPDERFSCSSCSDCVTAATCIGCFGCLPVLGAIGSTILFLWLGGVGELVIVLSVYLGVPSVWYGVRYVRAKLMENPAFRDWAVAARASDARSWRPWTWRQNRRRDDTAASAAASVSAAALDAAQVEIHTGTDRSEP